MQAHGCSLLELFGGGRSQFYYKEKEENRFYETMISLCHSGFSYRIIQKQYSIVERLEWSGRLSILSLTYCLCDFEHAALIQ